MRRLTAFLLVVLSPLEATPPAAAPVPAVREIRLGPIAETKMEMEVVFTGPSAPCGERLKGRFSAFGSEGVPLDGAVAPQPEGGCSIRLEMPFSALGPEVLANANVPTVGWSFMGERSSPGTPRPASWAGSVPREAVRPTESMKIVLARFVRVRDVSVGNVGFGTSTVTVVLEILQPLSFDVRFVGASYELVVAGAAVASGRRENLLLHPRQRNTLQLPMILDHGGLLRAVGAAASSGRVEGALSGLARLRVPSGELEFSFKFPVTISP